MGGRRWGIGDRGQDVAGQKDLMVKKNRYNFTKPKHNI